MNVALESLPNCMATLRVELPPDRVEKEREEITRGFIRDAKLPGYRPGKAPKNVITAKYKAQIEDELRRRLVSTGFREAADSKKLKVLTLTEVDEAEFSSDQGFQFKATLVTAPEFELPEYQNIATQALATEVTEEEFAQSLEDLRERSADFKEVEGRPIAEGDFGVFDSEGSIDGKPVAEVSEKASRLLGKRDDMWLKMAPESYVPGFCPQLIGMNKGEQRSVDVTLGEDFPITDIAGKPIHFEVTLKEIRERALPELTDEWAATVLEGKNLEEVKQLVREELSNQKETQAREAKRRQIIDFLIHSVQFELPQNFVKSEARRIMDDMVRENTMRGVPEEELRNNEEQIIQNSTNAAHNRVKLTFILLKIAEKEGMKVSQEELIQRLNMMASRYQMTLDKLIKKLRENNALPRIEEEILTGKVLDFLDSKASVSPAA